MKELDWFVNVLKSEFNVKVVKQFLSFEGNVLYVDEIDEALIPSELIDELPKNLLFETMMYVDDGVEWLGAIIMHPDTRKWLIQFILKDGEVVLRNHLGKEME